MTDLDEVWPKFAAHNKDTFHKNEWNKHGECYLKLNLDRYGDKYTKQDLFFRYFNESIAKARLHNKVTKFLFDSKEDLANELKIENINSFYVSCKGNSLTKTNRITELYICYDLSEPGNEKEVDCFDGNLQYERNCYSRKLSLV